MKMFMATKLNKMPSSSKFGLERSASSCGRAWHKNRHRLEQKRFSERKSSLLGGIVGTTWCRKPRPQARPLSKETR